MSLADTRIARRVLFLNGWTEAAVYVPPVVGAETWEAARDGWAERAAAERERARRRLGIGVGELAWSGELPPEGLGFHPWETDLAGVEFRWTPVMALLPPGAGASLERHRVLKLPLYE